MRVADIRVSRESNNFVYRVKRFMRYALNVSDRIQNGTEEASKIWGECELLRLSRDDSRG